MYIYIYIYTYTYICIDLGQSMFSIINIIVILHIPTHIVVLLLNI